MLNGWDVLGIIIIGVVVYAIINDVIMSACAKKAIDKAEKLGCTKDELFKYVDEKIKEATEAAIKAVESKVEDVIVNDPMIFRKVKSSVKDIENITINTISKTTRAKLDNKTTERKTVKKPGRPTNKSKLDNKTSEK